jgi:hypothetical protein
MEACRRAPELQFEGGFHAEQGKEVPGFEEYLTGNSFSHRQWIERTQRSVVAFNTPSYAGCNPWRTPEYLAMGKAVISTPLIRPLPTSPTHGVNIHFVDGSVQSIQEALARIRGDASYRQKLEQGARRFYLDCLRPHVFMKRVAAWPEASPTPASRGETEAPKACGLMTPDFPGASQA